MDASSAAHHHAAASPAAASFAAHGYAIVRGVIAPAEAARLCRHLQTRAAQGTLRMAGDEQVPQTPSVYGDPEVDRLMLSLVPAIEGHLGLGLFPTYSYARVYKRGDTLAPHRDRAACEISVSLNLGLEPSARPWALNLATAQGDVAALLLPGDALFYRGMELTHWRDAFDGDTMAQVFLHYVDRNGPHAGEKYDGRPSLGSAFQPEMTGRIRPFSLTTFG